MSNLSEYIETETNNSESFKNKIINGDFSIWQRGDSFVPVAAPWYTVDRWRIWSPSSINANKVIGVDTQFDLKITPTTNTLISFYQATEKPALLLGKDVTLTFEATIPVTSTGCRFNFADTIYANGNTNIEVPFTPVAGKHTYSTTINLSSHHDVNNLNSFWVFGFIIGSAPSDVIVHRVQVEEGTEFTGFENRNSDLELKMCQRYYQHFSQMFIPTYLGADNHRLLNIPRSINMRTTPAVTGTPNLAVTVNYGPHPEYLYVYATGMAVDSGLIIYNYNADAEI